MAVSPGPASTVLRFLRGGCGGDCLCGRLCEPCRGQRGPDFYRGVVDRVLPERVVLRDGRVFRRPGGSAPRPGQDVLVDDRPGLIVQTPQHQPRSGETATPVFVPPLPSWDSPQRPGRFGAEHLPRTDERGTFLGERGTPAGGGLLLDDGRVLFVSPHFIDHARREVRTQRQSDLITEAGYAAHSVVAPPISGAVNRAPELRLTPFRFALLDGASAWLTDLTAREGGRQWRDTTLSTLTWTGDEVKEVLDTETRSGTVYSARVRLDRDGAPGEAFAGYELLTAWAQPSEGPQFRTRERILYGLREFGQPVALWRVDYQFRTLSEWGAELQPVGTNTRTLVAGPLEWQTFEDWPLTVLVVGGKRFVSPDGKIVIESADIHPDEPQHLRDGEILTAYGHVLTGGTWAALRDNPRWDAEKTAWDFSPLIVLHERGETVTAIRPDGKRETCDRAQFEMEVLRCEAGTFQGFSPVGLMEHSWPPQWAFAICGEETRALAAHDPWRDSTRRRVPETPSSWAWPGRPARRPKSPPMRPHAPLGVTLADIFPASQPEPLAKGEGPLRLPGGAELFEGARVVGGGAPLAAVAKRLLYAPAEWPEELDDRTGIRGGVRLTWAQAQGKAVLLIRARAPATGLTVQVDGKEIAPRKLGHNVRERRGYHSYLLVTEATGRTLDLKTNGVLTRVLRFDRAEQTDA